MNVFQTGEWMITLAEGYGYTPCCIMFEGAGLPYMIDTKFGIKNYYSMPFDTYGGVDQGNPDQIYALTKTFAELPGIGYRYIVTYEPQVMWPGFNVKKEYTEIKDISGDLDDMWNGLHKDTRTAVRSASNRGVTIREADEANPNELLGTKFPEKLLNALDYHMGRYYLPYVAIVNDEVVTADIFFMYGDTMTYWASVNTRTGKKFNANSLILWHAIVDAHNAGCKVFNFGASPKGATNLVKFKKSWNTTTHEYQIHYIMPTLLKPLVKVKQWLRF